METKPMRHLDLFSGIGGFALAARWMGWETVQFVEIDKFCQKVLNKNFPNVPIHDDIKTFDGTQLRGTVDILTGGFPCQPYSTAGKRLGKEDSRHLWPEMLRVIREVQPTFIVGENVHGLVNWNGGLVFDEVQTDLESASFEVTSCVLPACGKDAPHRRDRVWFIAHASSNEYMQERELIEVIGGDKGKDKGTKNQREWHRQDTTRISPEKASTNAYSERIQGGAKSYDIERERQEAQQFAWGHHQCNDWRDFPTQSAIRGGDDGLPANMDVDSRIQALGNAIVPQVAFEIFKAITSV